MVDKHWYPWLPSAAQVRSGPSIVGCLDDLCFFQCDRRLLPVVSLRFQCFILVLGFQQNLAVHLTREVHDCFIRSAMELPTWFNERLDAHLSIFLETWAHLF